MKRPISARPIIRRLLARHGISRYRLFLLQAEGKSLPDGSESLSGFVLDSSRRVYGFWLDFDEKSGTYALQPFYEVIDPDEQFLDEPEYKRAKDALQAP